jgi:hypothetical protein
MSKTARTLLIGALAAAGAFAILHWLIGLDVTASLILAGAAFIIGGSVIWNPG